MLLFVPGNLAEHVADRRVEAVVPIEDVALQERLDDVLEVSLEDDVLAWEQLDDEWSKVGRSGHSGSETHLELEERARKRAEVGMR